MGDRRRHRGAHPDDQRLFTKAALPRLRAAVGDLSWLLSRGYALPSSLALVGDRYQLVKRQRLAVMRCACGDAALASRRARELKPAAIAGRPLRIDGLNVLVTVEAALAGGVLLRGRDGCIRDLASVHGSYRVVEETERAVRAAAAALQPLEPAGCTWLLDAPVSNSGRLRGRIEALAAAAGWPWEVRLVQSPDAILAASPDPVATTDSAVLDRCGPWLDLARHTIAAAALDARVLDLATP